MTEKSPKILTNFTVNEKGQIVKDGIILPLLEGIKSIVNLGQPEKKKRKQKRFKDGSYLTNQQSTDEEYQTKNDIS